MFRLRFTLAFVLLALLAACGGGGGGGGGTDSGGGQTQGTDYPTLMTAQDFNLTALPAPPERAAATNQQVGQVRESAGSAVGGGVLVELLDATSPDSPVVVASTRTQSDGSFTITDAISDKPNAAKWLRATLASGASMRAFATGWTDVTPGSETALSEIGRLLRAGAFSAHTLTAQELAGLQSGVTLVWEGRYGAQPINSAVQLLTEFLRLHQPWNQQLDNLDQVSPQAGVGDIAGLWPIGTAVDWSGTATINNGAEIAESRRTSCTQNSASGSMDCSLLSITRGDVEDRFDVFHDGIRSIPATNNLDDPIQLLLYTVGEIPIIEFPVQTGARVVFENPKMAFGSEARYHGSARITRRTYAAAPLDALGATVQAVEVDIDYELAVIDTRGGAQTDVLIRERRWFSPEGGVVRKASERLRRQDGVVTRNSLSYRANSVSGSFFLPQVVPFAGVLDDRSISLRYRHAVWSPSRNRIYVASVTPPELLELDPETLMVVRRLPLPAVAGRLAVAQDGSRVYVGLDGGTVSEFNLSTLALTRSFSVTFEADGVNYDRVYDLQVDPRNPARLLVLAGRSSRLGNYGAVLLYSGGSLVLRDAPRYSNDDFGWSYYGLTRLRWSESADQFLGAFTGSPTSLYRFGTSGSAFTEIHTMSLGDDIGIIEIGGEIVTSKGKVLDSQDFSSKRQLAVSSFPLSGCHGQDSVSDLCAISGSSDPFLPLFVRLGHESGQFLGAYRPKIDSIANGCAEFSGDTIYHGLDGAVLTSMNDQRSLVTALPNSTGEWCGLHVWSLHGVSQ